MILASLQASIFPLPQDFYSVEVAYEFEACIHESADIHFSFGYSRNVFLLVFKELLGELHVDQGVLNVFVTKGLHNVQDVFGFMVFPCAFPVSKRVERYLLQPWIF